MWRHGDWIEITDRSTAVIYGRSDSTINRGGVRMGTSEIYRAVLADPEVIDAVVVDVPREGRENWMPLFVVVRPGGEFTPGLAVRIKKPHPPRLLTASRAERRDRVPEVPRTLSGKLLEIPVKRILMGEPPEQVVSREG